MSHHHVKETYTAESITTELQRGNNQEAARETNLDLHGLRDFQKTYQEINARIDKINSSRDANSQLPHVQLVDGDGKEVGSGKDAKGIKISDTTYGTDTVRDNSTYDPKTKETTVRTDNDVKHLDKDGNQILRDSTGHERTIYTDKNQPTDEKIGKVKAVTTDGQGNRVLEGEGGVRETIDAHGKRVIDYPDGARVVWRTDGTGCKVTKDANGVTHIHAWSPKDDGNYDVTVNSQGRYTEKFSKDSYTYGGKHYEYKPDEKM